MGPKVANITLGQTPMESIYHEAEVPWGQKPIGPKSCRPKVPRAKVLWGHNPMGQKSHGAKVPWGQSTMGPMYHVPSPIRPKFNGSKVLWG